MSFFKKVPGAGKGSDVTEGFHEIDWEASTPCQREATARLGRTIQLEQEAFLSQNPKFRDYQKYIKKSTSSCKTPKNGNIKYSYHVSNWTPFGQWHRKLKDVNKMVTADKSRESLKDAAVKIMELCDDIDDGPGLCCQGKPIFTYEDPDLELDLKYIYRKHYPPPPLKVPPEILQTPNTLSSSFISIITSETTIPTPEPVPTPEPTLSEVMMQVVSNTVDKAIYSQVNEAALRYDTAYVELSKAVEEAMEIPVIEIKADIAELFFCAYRMFELNIIEKERIGYESPPTPKSEISSHPSYKIPPPRPCVCHPQFHYNRYPKDRFGIYLPRGDGFEFSKESVTVPTVCVAEEEAENEEAVST